MTAEPMAPAQVQEVPTPGEPAAGSRPPRDQATQSRSAAGARVRPGAALLLLASLGLAVVGQFYLDNLRQNLRDGMAIYLVAIGLFLAAVRSVERAHGSTALPVVRAAMGGLGRVAGYFKDHLWRASAGLLANPWRAALGLVAAEAGLLALIIIHSGPRSYLGAFLLWVASSVSICAAVAPRWPSPSRQAVRRWALARRGELLAVGGVLLVAFVLRTWSLDTIPYILAGDEASQGQEALYVLDGRQLNPFHTGWLSVPTMAFFWQAGWLKLFGVSMFGLRLPWAVVGTLTVLTTYLLVRQLFGRRFALVVAILLAGYDYHIHYSRLGSVQVTDPLFMTAALYFLVRGLQRWRSFEFALCGAVLGLAQYFYAGARLTQVLVALILGFLLWKEPRLRREGKRHLVVLVASALLVAAPMIRFALLYPNDYNARINTVGIFQSGWIYKEQALTGASIPAILFDQFQRSVLAFNFYPDRTVWYGSPQPLLGFPASLLFALGLAYATFRFTDRRLFPFVAWFWSAIVIGGMLTESPPSSQRLITLAPPAIFFVALGLNRLVWLLRRAWGIRASLAPVALVAAVVLSALSVKYYFVDFTPQRLYGGTNAWVATDMGKYLRGLGPEYRVYFAGTPRLFWGFASVPFLAPGVEGQDVLQPLTGPPTFVRRDKDAVFIFIPERAAELQWVQRAYPNGLLRNFPDPLHNQPLFLAYEVPRAELGPR